jgi:hypothetical protein
VLAGGRGERLGGDKPAVLVAGRTLLSRVLDAVPLAVRMVVVAPLRSGVARLGGELRGASIRSLLAGLKLNRIRDLAGRGRDVDTWQDVEASALLMRTEENTNERLIPPAP